MKKVMKYISMSKPITFKQIANSVRTYEKQFLLAKWERWSIILNYLKDVNVYKEGKSHFHHVN